MKLTVACNGDSIICLISAARPHGDLGVSPGRLDGATPGGGGDVPAGLPEGAGEVAGAPAHPLDPDVDQDLPGGDRRAGLGPPKSVGTATLIQRTLFPALTCSRPPRVPPVGGSAVRGEPHRNYMQAPLDGEKSTCNGGRWFRDNLWLQLLHPGKRGGPRHAVSRAAGDHSDWRGGRATDDLYG